MNIGLVDINVFAKFDEKSSMVVKNLRKQTFMDRKMNGKRDNVKRGLVINQKNRQIQCAFDDI